MERRAGQHEGQPAPSVTALLLAWREGDNAALAKLTPIVYKELRRLAHQQMKGEWAQQTLQTTALVNEAYLRLVEAPRIDWKDRAHFFAISAQIMRRILIDYSRRHNLKRGAGVPHVLLAQAELEAAAEDPDLVALDEALDALQQFDPRKAKVVELRFFGGLSVEEAAEVLKISPITVMRDWSNAKAWLYRELTRRPAGG